MPEIFFFVCWGFFFLFSSKPLKYIQVLENGKRCEQTGKLDSLDSLEGTACTPFAGAAGHIYSGTAGDIPWHSLIHSARWSFVFQKLKRKTHKRTTHQTLGGCDQQVHCTCDLIGRLCRMKAVFPLPSSKDLPACVFISDSHILICQKYSVG